MYFPQTTNDLQSCTGPGGSPLCADPLSTIGSCLLALGGWVASCAEQVPSVEPAAGLVCRCKQGRPWALWAIVATRKTRLRLACCAPGRRLDNRRAVRSLHRRGCCGSLSLPGDAISASTGIRSPGIIEDLFCHRPGAGEKKGDSI